MNHVKSVSHSKSTQSRLKCFSLNDLFNILFSNFMNFKFSIAMWPLNHVYLLCKTGLLILCKQGWFTAFIIKYTEQTILNIRLRMKSLQDYAILPCQYGPVGGAKLLMTDGASLFHRQSLHLISPNLS